MDKRKRETQDQESKCERCMTVGALLADRDTAMTELRDSFNAVCDRRDEMAGQIAEMQRGLEAATQINNDHQQRIAELEKALRRSMEALGRSYDVTEWPAERGSLQLTVLNELKSLMERSS